LEVLATAVDGSPISGVSVNFKVTTLNGGTLSNGTSTVTVVTNSNGRASTSFNSLSVLGMVNVLASSSVGSVTFGITVSNPGITNSNSSMLLISAGNNQTVQPAGTKSLEVLAVNSLGVAMPGVAVKFEVVTSGSGTLTGGSTVANATTNSSGKANTTFTASSNTGPVTVIATSTAGTAVFTLTTATAGTTSSSSSILLITSGNNQSINPSSNAPKNLEVMAVNSLGIPMAGIPVSFEVVTTGAGTITGGLTSTTVNTTANGRAAVSFTSSASTGSVTVIATSTAGNAVFNLQVGNTTSTVASGSMLLTTNGNNQTVLQGTVATKNLEIMALNNLGSPMAGLPITFEILTSGAGTLTGSATTATATTAANGRASVTFTASNNTGPVSIIATSTAGSAVFNLVVNSTGTGSSLTISSGNGQSLAPNTASTSSLEVYVSNASGGAVSGVPVTFTVTTTNGGLLSNGTTTVTATTNSSGKALTSFQSGSATGNIAVLASSSAGNAVFNITVANSGTNANSNATLLVSNGNNQSVEQGTAAAKSLEVMAINSLGNPISGLQVSFTVLTSGTGTLTGGGTTATATTSANGRASVNFTAANVTGPTSVVATSTAGSAVFNLSLTPTGTGTILSISSGNGQSVVPSVQANVPLEVIATNSSGNPVANVPVTFFVTTLNSGTLSNSTSSVTVNTNASGKASTTYTSGSNSGMVSVLASTVSGSVLFNVNVQSPGTNNAAGSMVLVTNGNAQSVEATKSASKSLEVMALSSLGVPMSGVTFNFQILTSGAGTLTGGNITASASTDASGKASVAFTSTSQLGPVTILASSTAGSAVFNLTTISAGTGSILTMSSGNGQSMNPSAAAALPLEVIATNASGTPVAGVAVSFTVTTASGGTLSTATATTGANGKASTNFTASSTTGNIAVLASSVSGTVVFNLNVANSGVNTSNGSLLMVTSGNNQSVEQGTTSNKSLEVLAVNSLGNAVPGVSISFKVLTSGAGTLTSGATTATTVTATTAADGRASVDFNASTQNGPVTVMASSTAGSAVFNLSVIPTGSSSTMTISSGNNQTVVPSAAATAPLEVIVTNSTGTPVQGIAVNFSVTTSNGGTLSSATATTNASGKATTNFTAGNVNGNISVLATSISGSTVFNLVVASPNVNSSNASTLVVTNGNNQSVEQSTAASKSLEVTALNNLGNPIGGVSVSFKVMTSGAGALTSDATTATTVTATTAADGRASVAFTASSQTGPVAIMASSTAGSAVFNLNSIASGTGSVISISSGNGQSIAPSSTASIPLEIIATNSSGAPVSGITVNFSVSTTSGGSVSSSTATTNASGKASTTFSSSSTTGNIAVLASTSNGSVVFNVNVASAGSSSSAGSLLLATSGNNQSVEQGTTAAKSLEVMAVNSLGNPMSGVSVSYKILTSSAGTLTGGATTATATTGADGRASVAFTASSQTGPLAIIASSTAGSAVFNLNTIPSGTGSTITISSGNGQTVTPSTFASIPLEIVATNSSGTAVSGLTVNFAVTTASGGTLSVASATTNASGKASTNFTSSSTLGNVSILASTLSGSVVFNVNVANSAVSSSVGSMILLTSGDAQSVEITKAASRSLEIMAVNSLGTPMSGVQVTYQVLTSGAGTLNNGTTTASSVNTVTGMNGRASVTFTASSQLGHTTVLASSSAGSAVFNLKNISAGASSILTISRGNGQIMNPSTSASVPLEVIATDSSGSPVSGVAVTFNVTTADGGTLSNSTSTVTTNTDSNGKASTTFTSLTTSGIISVLASSVSGSAVFNLTVRDPGVNSSTGSMLLVTNGNNQSIEQGTTAGRSLEVMAVSSLGTAMAGVPVTFEMITSGAGTLTGSVTTKTVNTGSNGRASVNFTATNQVGSASVIATSTAGNAVFNITVNNTLPTKMVTISGGNNQTVAPSAQASTPFEVIVTQADGTPVSGVDVSFTVTTANGGTLSTATDTSDSNGKASTTFTAGSSAATVSVLATSTAGTAVFTVNVANASSGGGGGGGSTTGSSGSSLLITNGNNQVLEQGLAAPTDLEVLAVNSSGDPIANVTISFQVASGSLGTGGTTGTATTGSNGRANISYTASNSLGPISVIATSSAGSAVFNLTIGAQGAGSSLSISSGNGQLLLPNSNASSPLEVIATNASGSPVANVPVTFTVTTTNGGVLSNSTATITVNTNSSGKASTTFSSSNTVGSISVLASSRVGSVTFSLNTNQIGGGNGGGGGSPVIFSPTTYVPASSTWVNVEVGASPTKTVTVTNSAATNVYINSVFTTSTTPFSKVSDTCPRSPSALASAATCTITIAFSPTDGATVSKFMFVNWSSLADGSNGTNAVLSLEGSGPSLLSFAGISSATNITTNSVQLNWNAASGGNITQYRVYNTTGTATQIATLPAGSNTYTVTNLNPNTTYKFRVYAVNSAGTEDGNTNDATITTLQVTGPVLQMTVTSPSADTGFNNWVYPSKAIRAGFDTFTADVNSNVTGNDTGPNGAITYTCKFSRNTNSSSAGKSTCSAGLLGGTFSFNGTTGAISWTPRLGTQGLFEFEIKGSDVIGPTYKYFLMDVGHPYSTTNLSTLLADFRTSFSNMYDTQTGTSSSWMDISGKGNTASITGTPNWAGTVTGTTANTTTDPQRMTFNGTTELNLGTVLSGLKSFMIDYWLSNPETDFTNGAVVLKMDTDNTDNGFKVTQNTNANGKRMLRFDFERSYARAIAVDNPSLHWRIDEASGNTFSELITTNSANQLSFVDGSGAATSTGLALSQTGATLGEKSSTGASFHTNKLALPNISTLKPAGDFSVEFWVKYPNRGTPADHTLYTLNTTGTANGLSISIATGVFTVKYKPSAAAAVTLTPTYPAWGYLFDQNWHHVVFTSINNSKNLYLDGNVLSTSTTANGAITWPTTADQATVVASGDSTNPVILDELAFYGFALSSNQVKNHLAAGDHFIRNQALFPANSVHQAKPTGYWRMGENNQGNYQDFSGNQNNLFDSDWATYLSPYGGVYMRTGGSGLDNDGASYQNEGNYKLRSFNLNTLTFNDKFTYSGWINFINYPSTDRYLPFFSWNNNGANTHGFLAYISNDGFLNAYFDRTWSAANNYIRSTGPVLPTGNATQFPLGWYHVAMTYDGSKANNDRVNFYVNGLPVKMGNTVGTIPTSLSTLTNSNWEFELGNWHVNNGQLANKFNHSSGLYYSHDEDAIYDRVLTASEIRAQANEASLRYCDVNITSQVLDPVNTKPFDYINMLFDGTTVTIKRNSKLECALRPSVNLVGESLPIKVGASTNGFKGHLADLRVHGADVGVTVATITDAHKAFMQSSDQHRIVPLGNIVTDNLVRNYEASAASDGVRGYSPGCEISKMNWNEVGHMTNGNRQEPGYLYNWTTCATGNGWNGDGTPTNPYRLTFNGSGNWVDLGTNNSIFPYALNRMSACLWMRTTNSSNFHIITRESGNYAYGDFDLVWGDTSNFYFFLNYGSSRGNGNYANATLNSANSNLRNGNWHYVCAMYDGAVTAIYMDGTLVSNTPAYTGNIYAANGMNARLTLGSQYDHFYNFNWGGWYKGDIGAVHIYNSGLTAAQIKQNCNAQAANYNMTTCAP
jgi:adhesin/invasin